MESGFEGTLNMGSMGPSPCSIAPHLHAFVPLRQAQKTRMTPPLGEPWQLQFLQSLGPA